VPDLQDQGTQQQEEGGAGEGNAAATVGGERSFLSGNFGDVQIDILGLGELGVGQVSTLLPPNNTLFFTSRTAHNQVPMSLLTGEKEADRTNGAEAPKLLEENSTVGFEDDEEEGDSPADVNPFPSFATSLSSGLTTDIFFPFRKLRSPLWKG